MSEERNEMEKRVGQASGGEPEAGVRAEGAEERDTSHSTSRDEAPDRLSDEAVEAERERIEKLQSEGQGARGRSTEGREDQADESAIREATEGNA